MKKATKVFGIFLIGLLVADFVYPFLHEAGHAIVTILCGGQLQEFNILPTPYVVCNAYSVGKTEQCFIGLSGMFFPLLLSLLIKTKRFWLWLISFMIEGISGLAFGLSYIAILYYESGIVWQNEDIIKVIEISDVQSTVWLVGMLAMIQTVFIIIYKSKPLIRIKNHLEI